MLNRLEYRLDLLSLLVLSPFELFQPPGEFLVCGEKLPKPDKSPHDGDIYLDRPWAPEHGGEHCNALFCERVGHVFAMLATL